MSPSGTRTQLAIAKLGSPDAKELVGAAEARGWDVEVLEGAERLRETVTGESCDAVVILTDKPCELPSGVVTELLSRLTEIPVFFVFPPLADPIKCQVRLGVNSDQIWDTDMPSAELIDAIRDAIQCVRDGQPEYVVLCVDDDADFLLRCAACCCRA